MQLPCCPPARFLTRTHKEQERTKGPIGASCTRKCRIMVREGHVQTLTPVVEGTGSNGIRAATTKTGKVSGCTRSSQLYSVEGRGKAGMTTVLCALFPSPVFHSWAGISFPSLFLLAFLFTSPFSSSSPFFFPPFPPVFHQEPFSAQHNQPHLVHPVSHPVLTSLWLLPVARSPDLRCSPFCPSRSPRHPSRPFDRLRHCV